MSISEKAKVTSNSNDRMTVHATLRDALAEGAQINEAMRTYLRLSEWSPAMAFMLICGIAAKITCTVVPKSSKGLDGQVLPIGNRRLWHAKRYLSEWKCHWEDEREPSRISPFEFFIWCDENEMETEWLRQLQALAGFRVSNRFDRTYAAMAMIMDAEPARGLLGLSETVESNHLRKSGTRWTAEKKRELSRYKTQYGLKKTAETYGISKARIGQILRKSSKVSRISEASPWDQLRKS